MICLQTIKAANLQSVLVRILVDRLRARAHCAEPDHDAIQSLAARCRQECETLNQLLAEATQPKEEST